MKTRSTQISTLFFIAFSFAATSTHAKLPADFRPKLNALLTESQKSKPACNQFESEIKLAFESDKDVARDGFKDQASAQKFLRVLENRPPVSKATQDAIRLILTQSPKDLKQKWFQSATGNLQIGCNTLQTYSSLSLLIQKNPGYQLNDNEKNQTKALALALINEELSYSSSMTSNLIQIALLNKMNEAGLFRDKNKLDAPLRDLAKKSSLLRKQIETKFKKPKPDYADALVFEIFETQKLRKEIQKTFNEISK